MNVSYFATREFFSTAMHAVTCIGIPIHFFGAYCILFVTPESMKSVKWIMFNLHFWSVMLDWGFSFLTCPFIIIPALAGLTIGLFNKLGIGSDVQFFICTILFAFVNISIVSIVENRYYLLFTKNHWWRIARIPFLVVNYFFGVTYFIVPFLITPNQELAAEIIRKKIPQLPSFVFEGSLFILDSDSYLFYIMVLFQVMIFMESLIFCSLIVKNIRKRSKETATSERTLELQNKFLRALMIQIATPLILLITPLFYFGPAVLFTIYKQALNNISVLIMSMHGLTSTIVMILIHDPYRKFCWHVLSGRVFNKRAHAVTSPVVLPNLNKRLSADQVGSGDNMNLGFHQF